MLLFKEGAKGAPSAFFSKMPKPDPWPAPQPMFFPSGGDVADWFFNDGVAERNLITKVREDLISEDLCFLDIGAHVGTYSWICASKAKHTYSFECSNRSFCYLAANVALHDLTDKVSLFNVALGNTNGTASYIHRSVDGGGSGICELSPDDRNLPRNAVSVRRLDDMHIQFPSKIGLVKIDVEGFEKDVILGALETLRSNDWPPILFESWGAWKRDVPAEDLRKGLFDTLQSLGYEIQAMPQAQDMFLATHNKTCNANQPVSSQSP